MENDFTMAGTVVLNLIVMVLVFSLAMRAN